MITPICTALYFGYSRSSCSGISANINVNNIFRKVPCRLLASFFICYTFSWISQLPAKYCNIASKPKTSNPNIFFCVSSISERNISLITLCKCGKHRLKIGRLVISKNKVDFLKNVHVLAHSVLCTLRHFETERGSLQMLFCKQENYFYWLRLGIEY